MFGLEKLADWWDGEKQTSEKALDEFVDNHPDWFGIVVATAAASAMDLGAGFVDVLRVGEGVKEGGWGYGKDALRVLSFAGPAARLGRLGLARVTPNPSGGVCAWVASAKAIRQTGTKHFATAQELFKAAGHHSAPMSMAEMIPVLKRVGAATKSLGPPKSIKHLEQLTSQNANGVILFGVSWSKGGHALYAFRDMAGKFRIADRTGKVVSSLSEVERFYPGIGNAVPQGAAVHIMNSTITQRTTLASILALEVRTAMLVDHETAKAEIERIRAGMSATIDSSVR